MDARSLTASQAGLLTSAELTCSAVAAFVTSLHLTRLPLYRVTAYGIAVVAMSQLLSSFSVQFSSFVLLRVVCGCAAGVVGAATTSTIATAKNPDRVTGLILIAGGLSGVALMIPIAWANVHWRLSGVFTVVSLYCWVALLMLRWAPFPRAAPLAAVPSASPWTNKALAIPVLLGFLIWGIAEAALSAFTERLGTALNLSQGQIGTVFSILPLALLCGGGLCVILGLRFGRSAPLAISLLSLAVVIGLLRRVDTLGGFGTMLFAWTFLSTLSIPYVYGLLASLDERGRWVGLLAAASPIATGLGPLLGGFVVQSASIDLLVTIVLFGYAVSFVLIVPVCVRASTTATRNSAVRHDFGTG